MGLSIFFLLLCAAVIYFACEFFINAIEWLGRGLNLGATAVGTLLAAFGTALPESAVTFVAVVFGQDAASKDVGVGAALGGPLVLATITYPVVGVAMWMYRARMKRETSEVSADRQQLSKDQAWFLWIFAGKVALGLLAFSWKPWLGMLFVVAYSAYVWKQMRVDQQEQRDDEDIEPLRFRPCDRSPNALWAGTQTVVALIVIGVASRVFVGQLENMGAALNLAPHVVALLLSPIATELPETMNTLIWVRQGKERLALANVSGAMMIQATIPSALGIIFTPWEFDGTLLAGAICTVVPIGRLWWMFRRGPVYRAALVPSVFGYVCFVVALWWIL